MSCMVTGEVIWGFTDLVFVLDCFYFKTNIGVLPNIGVLVILISIERPERKKPEKTEPLMQITYKNIFTSFSE